MEERLATIEAKIAYQDQSIRDLSEEIYRQQQQLQQLERTCKYLIEELQAQTDAKSSEVTAGEKPPHY
jgi:SlyX protein